MCTALGLIGGVLISEPHMSLFVLELSLNRERHIGIFALVDQWVCTHLTRSSGSPGKGNYTRHKDMESALTSLL